MFGYTLRMILLEKNKSSTNAVQGLLSRHKIRPTSQRIEIAKILLSRPQHLSADQVLAQVNKDIALVSKATVYNTLNLFAKKGLVRQVVIESGKIFFDSNTEPHHHIFNEDTGLLLDVDSDAMVINNLPVLPADLVKSGVDIIIRVKNKF